MIIGNVYQVSKVLKKSSAGMFKNLKEGDLVYFSLELKPIGRSRNGTYATYITCTNYNTREKTESSLNQLGRTLACFEWKEL